jgi:heptosyltransferase-2
MLKKELIGWSIFGKQYRFSHSKLVLLIWVIDLIGNVFFSLRKRECPKNPKSILVIQLDHIGDMLLNSSLIRSLKQTFPDAKISVLIRSLAKPVAEMIDGIDEIFILHTPWLSRENNDGWVGVLKFCSRFFKVFDLVFEVHGEFRNNFIAWMLGKFTVGSSIRGGGFFLNRSISWGYEYGLHICEMQNKMVEIVAGKKINTPQLNITIPQITKEKIANLLHTHSLITNEYVFVQMSTGGRNREWPLENWKKLIKLIIMDGNTVVTADLDKEKVTAVDPDLQSFFTMSVMVCEYAELVKNAKIIISVDTFCGHIASCFGVPTISLYSGANLWEEWRPYNVNVEYFQDKSCPKYPCGLHHCVFGHYSECMKRIDPEGVFERYKKVINQRQKNNHDYLA